MVCFHAYLPVLDNREIDGFILFVSQINFWSSKVYWKEKCGIGFQISTRPGDVVNGLVEGVLIINRKSLFVILLNHSPMTTVCLL
jgi:hypothetical protein